MGDQGRIARIADQSGDPIDDADPPVGLGQQHHSAVRGDASAIEGRAHLLARYAWQIEQKVVIVGHGGCGASSAVKKIGLSNRILFQNNWLRYSRQPEFTPGVNKTG